MATRVEEPAKAKTGRTPVVDTLRRLMTAGLGTLEVTEAKIREAIEELSERGEVTEREAKQIVAEWAERLREQQKRLRSELEEAARQAVARSPFVRRTDFDRLKRRIDALERKLKGEGVGDDEC